MNPKEIVNELNRFIVGQCDAKKSVAIALRNRWRRARIDGDIKNEILPKNILMIGATGVGKTEIARRLAKLSNAPFIKVEATKFTEIGYVGRDVEQIIRDLVDISVHAKRDEMRQLLEDKVKKIVDQKLLEALVGENPSNETLLRFQKMLNDLELEDNEVEIFVSEKS